MKYKVHPLVLGEAEVPNVLDVFWSLTTDTDRTSVPFLAFLIEGAPDGPILVDTGLRDPKRATDVHRLGPHYVSASQTLEAQLGRFDTSLGDVKTVILTHLHYDHAGNCRLLPNARFLVQRTELMAAAAPMGPPSLPIAGKDLFFDRLDVADLVSPLWDRVDLLEGDVEICPGLECVLYANTHTPGHQCVYVETEEGTAAIIGDIARKVQLNIVEGVPPGLYYDLEATRRALADIKRRADYILPTHDWSIVGGRPEGPPG